MGIPVTSITHCAELNLEPAKEKVVPWHPIPATISLKQAVELK